MKHFKIYQLLGAIWCCVLLGPSIAFGQSDYQADIVIPTIVENSLQQNKVLDGEHGKIVQNILTANEGKLTSRIMAPSHAFQAFYDKKFACVTPDTRLYYDDGAPYIDSEALSSTQWVLVQRQGDKPVLVKEDLQGKLVGTFYAPDEIASIVPQEGVSYDVYADLKTNLVKVAMQRIDMAILPHRGLLELITENEALSGLTISLSPPLATAHEGIMCHDDARGREVIKMVNDTLKRVAD